MSSKIKRKTNTAITTSLVTNEIVKIRTKICDELEFDLNYYIKNKLDFVLILGRHSATIKMPECKPVNYMEKTRSFKIFHILERLKKEVRPHLHFFDTIKKSHEYFFINYRQNYDLMASTGRPVCNIDIKSAYLNALFKTGFISNQLYEEICNLKKEDRLIIVGMLAYQPTIYTFKEGKLEHSYVRRSEYRNVFFYCVEQIEKIMRYCMEVSGDYAIGTWVDGIYFLDDEKIKKDIEGVLKFTGYNYSVDYLTDFQLVKGDYEISLQFKKEGKEKKISYPTENKFNSRIQNVLREKISGKRAISVAEFESFL